MIITLYKTFKFTFTRICMCLSKNIQKHFQHLYKKGKITYPTFLESIVSTWRIIQTKKIPDTFSLTDLGMTYKDCKYCIILEIFPYKYSSPISLLKVNYHSIQARDKTSTKVSSEICKLTDNIVNESL